MKIVDATPSVVLCKQVRIWPGAIFLLSNGKLANFMWANPNKKLLRCCTPPTGIVEDFYIDIITGKCSFHNKKESVVCVISNGLPKQFKYVKLNRKIITATKAQKILN